jgi:DNA-binding LacI/PurR family transcriptional regulator
VLKQGPAALPAYRVGPELQVAHFLGLGHESIAYASTTIRGMRQINDDRLRRVRQGATQAGAKFQSAAISPANAQDIVRGWARTGVTAVASFNDDTAAFVIGAALRSGIKVPDDLAVLGHDDSPIASMLVPSISTIRLDLEGLGRNFALQALAAASGDAEPQLEDTVSRAHLVLRESA